MRDEKKPTPFHTFVAEWRARRLRGMSKGELSKRLEEMTSELKQEAMKAGFRRHLTNACRPYRHMNAYVKNLHDIEDRTGKV